MNRFEQGSFGTSTAESYRAESASSFNPHGVRIERDIYLVESSPVNFLLRYFHEIGHILGDDLSYRDGDILTPAEVVSTQAPIDYSETFMLFSQVISAPGYDRVNNLTIESANIILNTFTLGKFDPTSIKLHYPVTQEELEDLLKSAHETPGIIINEKGELEGVNTKDGRDAEISAMAVEIGCLKILENTINSLSPQDLLSITVQREDKGDSHSRAMKIVERTYQPNRSFILPSAKDLGKRYNSGSDSK